MDGDNQRQIKTGAKRAAAQWCDYIWNPITGCQNRCQKCSARSVSIRLCGNIRQNILRVRQQDETGNFILEEPISVKESRG